MVAETGLEKENICYDKIYKTLYVLLSLGFFGLMLCVLLCLVVGFCPNNDQMKTKKEGECIPFYACFFPNLTGRASAKASQARACAVSKLWL